MTAAGEPDPADPPGQPARPGGGEAARTTNLRRALTIGAVAGLAFAALELRPAGSLLHGGSAPLGDEFGLVLLLIFGWLILLERTLRYYRRQVRHLIDLPPRAERLRDAALRLLPLLAVGLPAVLLGLYRITNQRPAPAPYPVAPPTLRPRPLTPPHPLPTGTSGTGLMGDLAAAVRILAVLAVLAGLIVVWRLLRRVPVPTVTRSVRTRTDERELADAVASARQALLSGEDARTAVIACYLAMEESLAASGIERLVADSPTDLLDRAVTAGTLHGTDATTLTALFREARFSRHPMDQTHLNQARTALDAIATQLAERSARTEAQDTSREMSA
ncbi:DUF4129 domain-containing protein [Kitasatospora sp. NBC_01266]|uniref:DUF4129 domain-containing protein n=1 Tax=Kitasatospora sp. NBC_01266 TaxID=2903572 RepID=UPI002E30A022|nr:DUF4129 domain-containing protein [Kitasatospora sp. NBC_01266]